MPALIRNEDARRMFMHLQGLSSPPGKSINEPEVFKLIERLGFVQIDSINTVERAHHQILFSRNQTYKHQHLVQLHENDAAVFENWTHDASIIPSAFYPYWQHRFARTGLQLRQRWRKWRRQGFEELLDDVRGHISSNGPTMSRDLTPTAQSRSGDGWWDWHPAKTALEYLWRTGEIAVIRRQGFQKVYDLSKRVIPDPYHREEVSHEAFVNWSCSSALDRLGFATAGEIAAFWEGVSIDEVKTWISQQGDKLVPVDVETAKDKELRLSVAWHDFRDRLAEAGEAPSRLRILSPFDPLLRDRARTERLFGFRYRIEVFVPEAKREYGYYVFPMLEGNRLVGRIDMKAHRKTRELNVKALWLEPGVRLSTGRRVKIDAEIERIRKFAGTDRITHQPGWLRC